MDTRNTMTVVAVLTLAAISFAIGRESAGCRRGGTFHCFAVAGSKSGQCYRTEDECAAERDDAFGRGWSVGRCADAARAFCFDVGVREHCFPSLDACESAKGSGATGCEER